MNRNLLDISDGKLYGNNDMVKISCHDCKGCSSCCQKMGDSIWLDPYDIFQLTRNLGKSFEELLSKEVELHVEDGLILPNIRMISHATNRNELACGFLNEEGRCSIHSFRPGFCRLFPLGRNYEDGQLTYFYLKDACPAPNKSKVKINKWLGIARIKEYERFLVEWHTLTKSLRKFYAEHEGEEEGIRAINLNFLQIFYMTSYESADFFGEFYERLENMKAFCRSLNIFL